MKFFCMDVHISVIEDFKTNCPYVEVVDVCMSGHSWVMNKQCAGFADINPNNWRDLSLSRIESFQKTHDSFLRSFDGFIVCHAAAFLLIYEKYGKPILMINSCRYDLPYNQTGNIQMIRVLNDSIRRMTEKRQLTIVSNNKADQLYTLRGTGVFPQWIPSLCAYTHIEYKPTRNTFLCYTGQIPTHPLLEKRPNRFEWKDLGTYKGIVHFPYEISTMSMFEHFTAGLPLFFPSKAFWKQNPSIQSISAYWGERLPPHLSDMKDPSTWIELSDIYHVFQSPNTYYFDSFPHLFELLESFVYVDDRELRQKHKYDIQSKWREVLSKYVL